jgi:putative Mn2+ efflux pump MntP
MDPLPGNLAKLAALLNIVACVAEVIGLAVGIYCLISAFKTYKESKKKAVDYLMMAIFAIATGLSVPGAMKWLLPD